MIHQELNLAEDLTIEENIFFWAGSFAADGCSTGAK